MAVRRAALVLAAVLLVSGCAYYNGLYNARQLAGEARRAEREGRQGEARSLWSRAAIKAESVAVRFPGSKWRDDALLLQGRALHRIDACTRAVDPLALAADSSPDGSIRTEARLLLAECRLFMREPAAAVGALGPITDSPDSLTRARALLWRGRAYLALDRPADALASLSGSDLPEAAFPRAEALARLGRADEGAAALGPRLGDGYDEPRWTAVLDTVGRRDADAASRLVDQLAARTDLPQGARARLLVSDGERMVAAGRVEQAIGRFTRAAQAAPDSVDGRVARAWLGVIRVRIMEDPADMAPALAHLRDVISAGGRPTQVAGKTVVVLGRVEDARTAAEPDPLRQFLAAEQVRDSLGAPRLAEQLFVGLAQRFPSSVLAPKALLAAAPLAPARRDSLLDVVRTRYAGSVYAAALRGEAGERYQAVEDSLRQAATALAGRRP